jgi:hypothetical protein
LVGQACGTVVEGSALRVGPRQVVETRILAVAYAGPERIPGIDENGRVVL